MHFCSVEFSIQVRLSWQSRSRHFADRVEAGLQSQRNSSGMEYGSAMKRYTAALFLFTVTVLAQAPASQKIVTLSFNAAVLQTAEAQKQMGALKARFAPRQAQLQTLNDEVEALRKQLSDPANKLSDTETATRQRSLESKEKQLQRQAEDFKNDSDSESQQAFQRVAQKVYAFLQAYAKQHG